MSIPIAAAFCVSVYVWSLYVALTGRSSREQRRGELLLRLGARHAPDRYSVDLDALGDQILLGVVVEIRTGHAADAEKRHEGSENDETGTHLVGRW